MILKAKQVLTESQYLAVRCALADLIGAYQSMKQQDYSIHDWDAHLLSINELAQEFDLESEVPELEDEDEAD